MIMCINSYPAVTGRERVVHGARRRARTYKFTLILLNRSTARRLSSQVMDISHCTSRAASARRDSRRPLARQRAEGTDHSVPSAVSVTTLEVAALSCCTSRGAQTSKGKARTRITLDTACSTEQDIVDRTAHTTSTIDETWIQKST